MVSGYRGGRYYSSLPKSTTTSSGSTTQATNQAAQKGVTTQQLTQQIAASKPVEQSPSQRLSTQIKSGSYNISSPSYTNPFTGQTGTTQASVSSPSIQSFQKPTFNAPRSSGGSTAQQIVSQIQSSSTLISPPQITNIARPLPTTPYLYQTGQEKTGVPKFTYYDPTRYDISMGRMYQRPATEVETVYAIQPEVPEGVKTTKIEPAKVSLYKQAKAYYETSELATKKYYVEPISKGISKGAEYINVKSGMDILPTSLVEAEYYASRNYLRLEQAGVPKPLVNIGRGITGFGLGALEDIKLRPVKQIGMYGLGFALAGGSEIAIKGTSLIPKVGKYASPTLKYGLFATGVGATGLYVAGTAAQVKSTEDYFKKGKIIGVATKDIGLMVAGGYSATKILTKPQDIKSAISLKSLPQEKAVINMPEGTRQFNFITKAEIKTQYTTRLDKLFRQPPKTTTTTLDVMGRSRTIKAEKKVELEMGDMIVTKKIGKGKPTYISTEYFLKGKETQGIAKATGVSFKFNKADYTIGTANIITGKNVANIALTKNVIPSGKTSGMIFRELSRAKGKPVKLNEIYQLQKSVSAGEIYDIKTRKFIAADVGKTAAKTFIEPKKFRVNIAKDLGIIQEGKPSEKISSFKEYKQSGKTQLKSLQETKIKRPRTVTKASTSVEAELVRKVAGETRIKTEIQTPSLTFGLTGSSLKSLSNLKTTPIQTMKPISLIRPIQKLTIKPIQKQTDLQKTIQKQTLIPAKETAGFFITTGVPTIPTIEMPPLVPSFKLPQLELFGGGRKSQTGLRIFKYKPSIIAISFKVKRKLSTKVRSGKSVFTGLEARPLPM